MPTYLRDDWYRDWGSLEQYHRLVPADEAPNAVIDEGSVRVYGWTRVGPIQGTAVNDVRIARWVATIAGLVGFVLSVATPLLPVVQTTATLNWPQGGQLMM